MKFGTEMATILILQYHHDHKTITKQVKLEGSVCNNNVSIKKTNVSQTIKIYFAYILYIFGIIISESVTETKQAIF